MQRWVRRARRALSTSTLNGPRKRRPRRFGAWILAATTIAMIVPTFGPSPALGHTTTGNATWVPGATFAGRTLLNPDLANDGLEKLSWHCKLDGDASGWGVDWRYRTIDANGNAGPWNNMGALTAYSCGPTAGPNHKSTQLVGGLYEIEAWATMSGTKYALMGSGTISIRVVDPCEWHPDPDCGVVWFPKDPFVGGIRLLNPHLKFEGNTLKWRCALDGATSGWGLSWEFRKIATSGPPEPWQYLTGPSAWACDTRYGPSTGSRSGLPDGRYEVRVWGDMNGTRYVVMGTAKTSWDPSNLRLRDVKPFNLELHWNDESNDETGFEIQSSTNDGVTWAALDEVPANTTRYAYIPRSLPVAPLFRVRAIRPGNATSPATWSNVAGALLSVPSTDSSAWWEPTTTMASKVAFGDPSLAYVEPTDPQLTGSLEWDIEWRGVGAWDEPVQTQVRSLDEAGFPSSGWIDAGSPFDCGAVTCANPHMSWTPPSAAPNFELQFKGTSTGVSYLTARTVDTEPTYVGMGDSYSSGEGIAPYIEGPAGYGCHRSTRAYPMLLNLGDAMGSRFIACTGAWTKNFLPTNDPGVFPKGEPKNGEAAQLDQGVVTDATDLVTVTIGGNDLDWTTVMDLCSGWNDCHDPGYSPHGELQYFDWLAAEIDEMHGPIRQSHEAILRASPLSRVVVLGYPQFFPIHEDQQNCFKLNATGFAEEEQVEFRQAFARFNGVVWRAAQDADVQFVDVSGRFSGHEICEEDEWINFVSDTGGPSDPIGDSSFHPTAVGQQAYAAAVDDALVAPTPIVPRKAFDGQVPDRSELGDPNPGSLGSLTVTSRCDLQGKVVVGESARVVGDSFRPGSVVRVRVELRDGTTKTIVAGRADARGRIDLPVRLQDGAVEQDALISAIGRDAVAGKRMLVEVVDFVTHC